MKYYFRDGVLARERVSRGMTWEQFSIWATSDGNKDRLKNCAYKNYPLEEPEMKAVAARFGRSIEEIAERAPIDPPFDSGYVDSIRQKIIRIEAKVDRLLSIWEPEGGATDEADRE